MDKKYNGELVPLARALRKNMTREESRLWYDFLKNYPIRFMRQRVMGHYIVDFYCFQAKLAVEVDGVQHMEEEALEYDAERTAFLNGMGIEVLRIPNSWVNREFDTACKVVDAAVKCRMNGEKIEKLPWA